MQTLTAILAITVLVVAAYGDIRRRLIPNELAIAVAILGIARMIVAGEPMALIWTLATAALVLFIGFLCFWRGWMGGGDAKLLAAVVLLVGHREVPDLLLIMSLVGGVIAVLVMAMQKLRRILSPLPVLLSFCGASLRLAASVEQKLDRMMRLGPGPVLHSGEAHSAAARPSVPYGVAIAAAGVTVIVSQFPFAG